MINCKKVSNMLSQYHDHDLSDADNRIMEKHLATCEDCREKVNQFGKFSKMLKGYKMATAPDNFLESLHERMKQEVFEPTIENKPIGKREPDLVGAGADYEDGGYRRMRVYRHQPKKLHKKTGIHKHHPKK